MRRLSVAAVIVLIAAVLPAARYAKGLAGQDKGVPAYHSEPPTGPLPKTMDPKKFDDPVARNAYTMAAEVEAVLYQQPCYCHCDEAEGHGSLLDCFVTDHGGECEWCQQEAIYAYNETKKGRSAADIRKDIMDGKWKEVDLSKYKIATK